MNKVLLSLVSFLLIFSGCTDKPYVIVQIADAQLGFTAAEKSQRTGSEFVNDLTYESDCLRKAVDMVNQIMPDAVVFTGDQVNYCDDEQQWAEFSAIISTVDKSVKLFHLPGNHDVRISGSKVDSSPFTERFGDDCFLHEERGVKLVGINTCVIKVGDSLETVQFQWLENVLVKKDPSDVALVFGHHPFFLADIDEPNSYFPIDSTKRRIYFDLFKKLETDAVYAGHRHCNCEGIYEDIPMKTTTSVAFQIGDCEPSIRVISVKDGEITDKLVEIFSE